jgi:hypothetical protein
VLDVLHECGRSASEDFHVAPAGTHQYLLTYTLHQPKHVTRKLTVWRRSGRQ